MVAIERNIAERPKSRLLARPGNLVSRNVPEVLNEIGETSASGRNRPLVSHQRSELDLLCEPQRVVYFYAKVAHRGFDLGVTEQQLDRSQIACLPMKLRDLCSAKRMRSEAAIVEPDVPNPPVDDAGILPRRNVRAPVCPTSEQVAYVIGSLGSQQAFDRLPRHFRDFELDGATGLELGNDPTIADESARADILCLETDQVRRPQLAVDSQVEESEVPGGTGHL